uniref:Carbohydrate sulfotransferase n=1 Tax=Branchiostoma floridae TaxID=7739 RepID=C4A0E6_BRAFL|eukprot:XP_002585721.1 hypothetical protein BRAFLDRAFT_133019 [Branchiostoma floridae]
MVGDSQNVERLLARGSVGDSQKEEHYIFLEENRELAKELSEQRRGFQSQRYLNQLVVIERTKTMYCYIPKTGCTTTKLVLYNLQHDTNESNADHELDWIHKQHFRLLKSYSKKGAERRLATYNKFIVVRDPLERLVSAWLDKFVNYPRRSSFIKRMLQRTRKENWTKTATREVKYDFIAHTDTLAEDLRLFFHKIGVVGKDGILPRQHPTRARTGFGNVFRQVPTEDIRHIGEIYKPDFDMFGYSFEEDLVIIEREKRDALKQNSSVQ